MMAQNLFATEQRVPSDDYRNNYDRIFGKTETKEDEPYSDLTNTLLDEERK